MKLHNEYLEAKVDEYEDLKTEMQRMQNKLDKYEKKIYIEEYGETDKKENEILILKAENTNLKNLIRNYEEKCEEYDKKNREINKKHENEILAINNTHTLIMEKLNKKIVNLEEVIRINQIDNDEVIYGF